MYLAISLRWPHSNFVKIFGYQKTKKIKGCSFWVQYWKVIFFHCNMCSNLPFRTCIALNFMHLACDVCVPYCWKQLAIHRMLTDVKDSKKEANSFLVIIFVWLHLNFTISCTWITLTGANPIIKFNHTTEPFLICDVLICDTGLLFW